MILIASTNSQWVDHFQGWNLVRLTRSPSRSRASTWSTVQLHKLPSWISRPNLYGQVQSAGSSSATTRTASGSASCPGSRRRLHLEILEILTIAWITIKSWKRKILRHGTMLKSSVTWQIMKFSSKDWKGAHFTISGSVLSPKTAWKARWPTRISRLQDASQHPGWNLQQRHQWKRWPSCPWSSTVSL